MNNSNSDDLYKIAKKLSCMVLKDKLEFYKAIKMYRVAKTFSVQNFENANVDTCLEEVNRHINIKLADSSSDLQVLVDSVNSISRESSNYNEIIGILDQIREGISLKLSFKIVKDTLVFRSHLHNKVVMNVNLSHMIGLLMLSSECWDPADKHSNLDVIETIIEKLQK